MTNDLTLVPDDKSLSEDYIYAIDCSISKALAAHKHDRMKLVRLTFECVASLQEAKSANNALSNKGIIKSFIGSLTGNNKKLRASIESNQTAALYAIQKMIQCIVEDNMISYDLLMVLNKKLNVSTIDTNTKISRLYELISASIGKQESKYREIDQRVSQTERDNRLVKWRLGITQTKYKEMEYPKLTTVEKVVCLSRDFFEITGGDWGARDYPFIQETMVSIGLNPNEEVRCIDILMEIYQDSSLCQYLLGSSEQVNNELDPNYLLSFATLHELQQLNDGPTSDTSRLPAHLSQTLGEPARKVLESNYTLSDILIELVHNLKFSSIETHQEASSPISYGESTDTEHFYTLAVHQGDKDLIDGYHSLLNDGDSPLWDLYYARVPLSKNSKEQLKDIGPSWYAKAAQLGDMRAKQALAYCYMVGHKISVDSTQAFHLFSSCAKANMIPSFSRLGYLYAHGNGVPQNHKEALAWYNKGLDANDPLSINSLGIICEDGEIVSQDLDLAIKFYKKAFSLGHVQSAMNLANLYIHKLNNVAEAKKWLQLAAQQDNALAQEILANIK